MLSVMTEVKIIPQAKEYNKGEIIIGGSDILRRINEMADDLAEQYQGKNVLLIGLLNGAFMVTSDLGQALWNKGICDSEVDFMAVSSYGNDSESRGELNIHKGLKNSPADRHVLLIDDVFDSGLTLAGIHERIAREAASVKSFVLVSKDNPNRKIKYKPDYIAFSTPNIWLEGHGMDSGEHGRLNPNIIIGKDYIFI